MTVAAARDRAIDHLLSLQTGRGDWEGEMVWCPMITAQYVIVQHIVGRKVDEAARTGLVRHFEVTRRAGGGWGLHPESTSYVFVTTLVYVALRLLGLDPEASLTRDARQWLHAQPGGILSIPTWGKFWLALIDLYDWSGVNPCAPELLLLPRRLPIHPTRLYCHTRLIYLAMADLYGRRVRVDLGPIAAALRDELYGGHTGVIDFAAHRTDLAASDVIAQPGLVLKALHRALLLWERVHPRAIRRRAVARCFSRLLAEQRGSAWHGLSPVNALLNCVVIWSRDPQHPALPPSLDGLEAWRWADDAEGVRYAGARSNAWDTAFTIRALVASDEGARRAADAVRRGCAFLRDTQMVEELPSAEVADRDPALGGWCFSDGAHRWPVSDCTAEAVGALLAARAPTDPTRLAQAAAFILSRQNRDGGFGTYERRRGPAWLDRLNPSEMFRDCMTERSYVECTGSAVATLARLPGTPVIERAIARGVAFLRSAQAPDGAVRGFWGINFTYGIFHFVKGLRAASVAADDPALARAAAWLVAHQRPDGGWGEHHTSCLTDRYVEHPESQVVMTSWALLALLEVVGPAAPSVERGVAWLIARQHTDGSWPRQAVNGVFFGSAMLDYRLYHATFPTWALARYAALTSAP